ncbi:hypothetical protein [Youngiibacter multivorans]|uniref:Uncharacterized protein n=1 Tax=Youngiibacter multivorans TaxID=937251 RepID=A0ABS4G4A4_9CLOT|nr:hypothetical protein [Youngiibacter multivorans]MBP1919366.1 hypothetical protein [Youngiibacter multivorans]
MTRTSKMFVRIDTEINSPDCKPGMRELLTEDDFNAEINKGISDLSNGNVISVKSLLEKMNREYGL